MLCAVQALFDLEATNAELKGDLRDLYIAGAKEVSDALLQIECLGGCVRSVEVGEQPGRRETSCVDNANGSREGVCGLGRNGECSGSAQHGS